MSMRRLEEQLKIWLFVVSYLLLEIKATAHPDINLTLVSRKTFWAIGTKNNFVVYVGRKN